jgi:hypothetical protein
MSQSREILKAFNNHFMEFVEDIINIFPNNLDLLTTKKSVLLLKKSNPKIIIHVWNEEVNKKYGSQIDEGDISFFIEKDYNEDLEKYDNNKISDVIEKLRDTIRNMKKEDLDKSLKYLQNLKKLSLLYFS